MKLIRFGEKGSEKPGLLVDGKRVDVSAAVEDYDRGFFVGGGLERLASVDLADCPEVPKDVRWASPTARPGNIIAIGLNYSDHARETGAQLPAEPLLFNKAPSSVCGAYDDLIIPRGSTHTDWEVELAVVLGKDAHYVDSPEAAAAYIAGYCVCHDVSERDFQKNHSGQWCKGKSSANFCPYGPALVTPDEPADPMNLDMRLDVNGERRQTGNTSTMVFNPCFLIHYISQFMVLEAGDLITTGTPPGVGAAMQPPQFLKPGDQVELEIDGLGVIRQNCVAAESFAPFRDG